MPSDKGGINPRRVSAAEAANRAEAREERINKATASTAGQGSAGVDDGSRAKRALKRGIDG